MKRAALGLIAMAVFATPALAQAVPEGSQADRLHASMRRWPHLGVDPFRHVFWPSWGLTVQAGAMGGNNTLNAEDVGALIFLSDDLKNPDGILIGDIIDAFGLVPVGQGVRGVGSGEGGVNLGGPFGGRFSLGLSAQGRGYGTFHIDDDAVRLFRDGNPLNQQFLIGETGGTGLVTGEGGVHALIHAGPIGSVDGARLTLGFGGRYLRPLVFAHGVVNTDASLAITDSSIAANVTVDAWYTDGLADAGSGIATDFLMRLTWPTAGIALEAMVGNLGKITVEGVQHERASFNVNTTSLSEVSDSLDAVDFRTVGVENFELTLPRIVRLSASAWANRILQLDVAATLPVEVLNDQNQQVFDQPFVIEMGSTWRLVNALPLRAGVLLGGHQGIGYTGGFGIESRNFLLRLTGSSLGGLFRSAKGAAARFEFGFFF